MQRLSVCPLKTHACHVCQNGKATNQNSKLVQSLSVSPAPVQNAVKVGNRMEKVKAMGEMRQGYGGGKEVYR